MAQIAILVVTKELGGRSANQKWFQPDFRFSSDLAIKVLLLAIVS